MRRTEVTVDALYTIADRLEEEKHLPGTTVQRIKKRQLGLAAHRSSAAPGGS